MIRIPEIFRGRGIAADLVKTGLDYGRNNQLKIIPTAPTWIPLSNATRMNMALCWPANRPTALLTLFVTGMLLISGCGTKHPPPRSLDTLPESAGPSLQVHPSYPFVVRWWEQFDTPELNGLITRALSHNFSIRQARARLEQAAALTAAQKAGTLPLVTMEGGYTRTQTDQDSGSLNTFSLGPAASYEVDLWGRINADITAAQLETQASGFDLETAAMTVAAEVSRTWVDLITAREQLSRVRKQLDLNTTVLNLLELRFENSMSSALEILQQREAVARTQAKIPPLENQIQQLAAALQLLLGQTPNAGQKITGNLPDTLPPLPQKGLPANLLALRPDVRAAGSRLLAADWNETAARADRLPDLVLTGKFLLQDNLLDSLLQNWILTLGSRLVGTVFDGGQQKALSQQAAAVVKERLATYEKVVHTAIVEVETSLAAETHQADHIALLAAQLQAAEQALNEARRRYISGMALFISFLTQQLNVQELEIRLLEQKALLVKNRIALYRALGGDWQSIVFPTQKEAS
jgi:outer membrane protein, multidrug efflux system